MGTCHVILTLRIFLKNYSNYYTFEKSITPNKIVTIIQQNKWKIIVWHTSDVTLQLITVAPAKGDPTLLFVVTLDTLLSSFCNQDLLSPHCRNDKSKEIYRLVNTSPSIYHVRYIERNILEEIYGQIIFS